MCNNSEYIRRVIGVTRTFYWTITTGGVDVDLEGRDLRLVIIAAKGGEQEMDFTTDANVLSFVWQGTAQTRIDKYSVVLWENYGEDSQRRVDIHNFVELVPWCAEQSGEYPDLTEETIELGTSDFTDQSGATVAVVDSLDSHSTTAALSANMGRVLNETKQGKITAIAPAYLQNDTLRLRMLAIGNDVMGFVGTQVYPEVTEQSGKDAIMPSIKAIEDHIVTPLQTAIGGKQDTIQDLAAIRSGAAAGATAYQKPTSGIPASDMASGVQTSLDKADTALQDAPADGQQYARKDHEWVSVAASGGGGSLTIVDVAAGTTAIAAEADTYYKVAGQTTNLAVTLPTMEDATKTAKCLFLITAGSNPTITFGTAQSGATLAYFDGYSIGGGYTYIIQAEWAGGVWQMREVRQSGGIGPSGQGEQVTVILMKKSGDSVTTISSGANVIVTVDGTATVYTTNVSGEVSFVVPYGYTYTVEAARRNGQYISGNAYTQTYTAGQTERTITFVFRSYESGLFITTEDGTDYTLEQWEEAVTAGTRSNSEALYIHVVTSAFVDRSATFLIKIDHLRDRSYGGNTQWCTTNVQFNTIALNGIGDYDGATQTTKVITEATQRGLSVPAFTRCRNLYETVGGVRADGFLGAYQQWQFLWNNKAEVDDILVYTRPSGKYTFSSLTTNKWTSSQSGASTAYYWASAAGGSNRSNSFAVIPFFAF